MAEGGGGEQTPISRLESQVELGGVQDANQQLASHREAMRQTGEGAESLGRAYEQMGQRGSGAVGNVGALTEQIKQQQSVLKELQQLQTTIAGGPGVNPEIDEAIRQTTQRIDEMRAKIGATGEETQRTASKMRESFLGTVSSVRELEQHLVSLRQTQARGVAEGTVTPGIAEEIGKTERFLKSLEDQSRTTARNMSQNFLATATSIEDVRNRLQALLALQQQGFAAGVRTPGLSEEIAKTQRAIKEIDGPLQQHGQNVGRTSIQYSIARSAIATLNAEIGRMGGVALPGLSQIEGVSAGLSEKFIGLGGAGALAVFGVAAVATAAVTTTAVLVTLGAGVQEAQAKIATSANISIEAARAQEKAFEGTRSGAVATSTAYAQVAGMLTTYNGQALTSAQATELMAAAQDGATATGQKLENVTTGFVRALIATHTPISQSRELMDVLYVTSLNTGVSIDQLGLAAARMVERTGQAAPSVRDLGIALTLAAQAGAQGQEGLEPVDNLIRNLSNNSPKAARDLEGLGVAVVKNSQGGLELAQTLLALKPAYDALSNDAQKYALAQELAGQGAGVLQAMLRLTSTDIQHVIDAYNEHNRTATDAATHAQTLGGMMGQLAAHARDAAGATGETLAGALVEDGRVLDLLGTKLREGITAWEDWARARGLATGGGRPTAAGANPPAVSGGDWDEAVRRQQEGEAATAKARENAAATFDLLHQVAAQEARPGVDLAPLRQQQELLSSLGSEAARLHEAMVAVTDPNIIPGGQDQQKALNDYLALITQEEAAIRRAYDPANPQQMAQRLGELRTLTTQYDAAVQQLSRTNSDDDRSRAQAIQVQIDLLNQRIQTENVSHEQSQKDAAFQRQQAAEAARIAREQQEADPLLGITQGLAKDRDDLIGTAGQVMSDLSNAVTLRGQQGARAAGEAFAVEARKWGESLEKAGIETWPAAFDTLIALGRQAVATGSPAVVQEIHNLLAAGEQQIRDANIGRAMEDAMAKANAQMIESESHIQDQLLRAQVTGAAARSDALQQEVDREYDIYAGRQVDKLETQDRNERELLRIREQWGREDADRTEQRARARTDLEENANRAARDRARDQARALADVTEQQARAQGDTTRSRQREDADAQYEHQKRLKEIARRGGDPAEVAKALAQENLSFTESIQDRTRKRQEDDAEAAIKRSQQVADAQRRQSEQVADANRRASEQAQDLARRQGEEVADVGKTRTRQIQARTDQQNDAEFLKNRRLAYEQQFHVDAETKAQERFQTELLRIDARYQHEEARAGAAAEQIRLKNEHELDLAAIRAQERFGAITPEESSRLQGQSEIAFAQQSTSISTQLRNRETAIDQALAQQLQQLRTYAPGFAPQNVPFQATAQYVPPGANLSKGDFLPTGQGNLTESLMATLGAQTKDWTLQLMTGGLGGGQRLPVELPEEQIQEIIDGVSDGVGNMPPMEMDGEVVESRASRIRRQRNLPRTLG